MTARKPWRFSESRPIRPFRISDRALDNSAFRARKDLEFESADPWHLVLEPEEIKHDNFRPELKLDVDADILTADTGINAQDLKLSVILRDPALLKSTLLASWTLDQVPDSYAVSSQDLSLVSGQRGLVLVLQVSPARDLPHQFRRASHAGHIVCVREFVIATPQDGAGFPVQTVESDYFEQIGLPKETVWIVQWKSTDDFDRPIEEVLSVLVSREGCEKLLRLSSTDSVSRVVWSEIAAEVFLEICLVVLASDPDEPRNEGSLLARLKAKLTKVTGRPFEEIVNMGVDGREDRFQFFRAHLQKDAELGNRIKHVNLAGRSS